MVVVLLAINALPVVQKGLLGLIERATEAEAGQRTAEEVAGEMAAFRFRFSLVVAANWLLFAAIIADMVLKPL
jgi:hypothetical protein